MEAEEERHERALAGAARADDAEERLLRQGERHLVEELASFPHCHAQRESLEGDFAGVLVALERAVDEPELLAAEPDDGVGRDPRLGDTVPVDERAVVAAAVDDFPADADVADELGVVTGHEHVVDDDVVVRRPTDADPGRVVGAVDTAEPAEPQGAACPRAVAARRLRHGRGRGLPRLRWRLGRRRFWPLRRRRFDAWSVSDEQLVTR